MTTRTIPPAFDRYVLTVPVASIVPQREVSASTKKSATYAQIASSLEHIGLIEPLVLFGKSNGSFLLLDGHTRLEILKSRGVKDVRCILARDDESYTYNKRVNHIPPIAQHFMLLQVLKNGVSEERVAAALNVNLHTIREKRDLLNGICREVIDLLHDRRVNAQVFTILKRMKPLRQIEAAEHMVASNTYSTQFAKALLAVTKPDMLNAPDSKRTQNAQALASQSLLEKENESILSDLKNVEDSYGNDILSLKIASSYLERIFSNSRIEKYLSRNHADAFRALQSLLAEAHASKT